MGTFGTGCCTGSHKFGAANSGWQPPTGYATSPGDPGKKLPCSPESIPSSPYLAATYGGNAGDPPTHWPEWMKKKGCGTISILKLQEESLGLSFPVLTPENVKKLAECVDRCMGATGPGGKYGPGLRDGLRSPGKELDCLIECKEMLMDSSGIPVDVSAVVFCHSSLPPNPDLSAMTEPWIPAFSGICPPLCAGMEVVIHYKWVRSCTRWQPPPSTTLRGTSKIIFGGDPKQPPIGSGKGQQTPAFCSHGGHAVRCKVITCCDQYCGDHRTCFACKDYEPQVEREYEICIDGETGEINFHSDITDDSGASLGQPGSCAKKFEDPQYRLEHAVGWEKTPKGSFCCERVYGPCRGIGFSPGYGGTAKVEVILFELPCPDGQDK